MRKVFIAALFCSISLLCFARSALQSDQLPCTIAKESSGSETQLYALGNLKLPILEKNKSGNEKPKLNIVKLTNMSEDFVFVQGGTIHPTKGIYTSGLTVNSFYMSKFELTQPEWEKFSAIKPYQDNFGNAHYGSGTYYPAYSVKWFDVIEYCNRRSNSEGLKACYSYLTYGTDIDNWPYYWWSDSSNSSNISCDWKANGYRLPSDAEWEFAARGGLKTHDYMYSGSNDPGVVGVMQRSLLSTYEVSTYFPNELGIYNMSGNVWEWCWDVHTGNTRVLRGGSFANYGEYASVYFRFCENPINSLFYIGFRLCRTSP